MPKLKDLIFPKPKKYTKKEYEDFAKSIERAIKKELWIKNTQKIKGEK